MDNPKVMLSKEVFEGVINYLAVCPYKDVRFIFESIQRDLSSPVDPSVSEPEGEEEEKQEVTE